MTNLSDLRSNLLISFLLGDCLFPIAKTFTFFEPMSVNEIVKCTVCPHSIQKGISKFISFNIIPRDCVDSLFVV